MWAKEEKEGSGADQLGEIDEGVLVPWMDTVRGEIIGVEVVSKIVEGSDDRVIVEVRPGDLFFSIKGRVGVDRKECGQESCKNRTK